MYVIIVKLPYKYEKQTLYLIFSIGAGGGIIKSNSISKVNKTEADIQGTLERKEDPTFSWGKYASEYQTYKIPTDLNT